MKMATITLIFLLLLALFFHPSSSLITQNNTDLIHKTCNQTDYYDVCVSSLQSDPRSSTTDDLSVYAKIFIELASSNATDTYSYIDQLLSNKNIDDDVLKMCLHDCSSVYDIGINDLKQGLTFLDLKEYIEVADLVGDAEDHGKFCDKVFKTPPVPKSPSPLTQRNEIFEQLCSIAVVILKLLG